ncbi:MAG: hypothetical protein WC277_00370 [Bacilli bacterium]
MMDIISMYCDFVIKPIEEHVKELRAKVYSRNFFDWLSRNLYKEYLDKTEKLLFEKHQRLGEIIKEEEYFNNEIQAKLKSID